ncbi:hypothetical protein BDV29DRAFT_14802 [Aspergillus leporis]|uniref:Uncharacterized protein n=1 Tax=Aspergillus leporis TaxID=41062 RepID=A0A5N5XDK4_9EURO|nr:hypothetical protein BDV29DRAFT_14802 [Aspergillus leporis]
MHTVTLLRPMSTICISPNDHFLSCIFSLFSLSLFLFLLLSYSSLSLLASFFSLLYSLIPVVLGVSIFCPAFPLAPHIAFSRSTRTFSCNYFLLTFSFSFFFFFFFFWVD